MQREIKFRGFQKSWIYGGVSIFQNEATIFDVNCVVNSAYEVDINSLGQFTGLKDIKGKEIYTCDILSDKWKVQVYQNNEGTFMVKFNTNPKINKPISLQKYLKAREKAGTSDVNSYRDCIVIGNIYENPELLDGSVVA